MPDMYLHISHRNQIYTGSIQGLKCFLLVCLFTEIFDPAHRTLLLIALSGNKGSCDLVQSSRLARATQGMDFIKIQTQIETHLIRQHMRLKEAFAHTQ